MAKRRQPPTRSGLLPEATHLVLPRGIVASGFPATEATCRRIGIVFDPWQRDLNRCILAKDSTGAYAADTVVMSIARQVGKTYDVGGIVFADSIINSGTTTVWTAHRFKVARESFNEMRAWAKSPLLGPHIDFDDITTAAGNECIPFRNGSRIVFAARERGAIRGFTKVRRLVLDEAQILTEHALSDLVPTMNQAVNPQLILMGTPPKPTDPGEVFTRLRTEAIDGTSEGVLYVELSADPESHPDDRASWKKANPSYPDRTPAKAILRLRKLLSVEDFNREARGIWDPQCQGPIDLVKWAGLVDAGSQAMDPVALSVDTNPERTRTDISAAGRREDGRVHIEGIASLPGTDGAVRRVVELCAKWKPCVVVLDPAGPAGAFIPELKDEGVTVKPEGDETQLHLVTAREAAQAAAALVDLVKNDGLRHLDDKDLNAAVEGATWRTVGDLRLWDRKNSTVALPPLVTVTLAAHGLAIYGPDEYDVEESAW